jgi:hypothetical protein
MQFIISARRFCMEVKDLIVKPISAKDANRLIRTLHYSGKVVPNSQIHLGVFLGGKCSGALQLGPSINKKGTINLVKDTTWNGFIELNRMAFADWLPRNSESRAIGYTMRWLKKQYPFLKWVVSFADATQCGDGTIYRASGFLLTGIRKNEALRTNPKTGEQMHVIQAHHKKLSNEFRKWEPLNGYQLRYIYFLDKSYKDKLTVPIIPFNEIKKRGISMYKGKRLSQAISSVQEECGGAAPTQTLQESMGAK